MCALQRNNCPSGFREHIATEMISLFINRVAIWANQRADQALFAATDLRSYVVKNLLQSEHTNPPMPFTDQESKSLPLIRRIAGTRGTTRTRRRSSQEELPSVRVRQARTDPFIPSRLGLESMHDDFRPRGERRLCKSVPE